MPARKPEAAPVSHDIRFSLNGTAVAVAAPQDEPLLFSLRNRLGFRATHFGCGLEQCGACVVGVNGVARYACTLPAQDVAGAEVVTAEGLAAHPIGAALLAAFEAEHAGQCGYCLAGILMSAFLLLGADPDPSRERIVASLDRHLCRCGAHGNILRAIHRAAAILRESAAP
jgi:nicotinate dehydrogenase subunit A